MARSKRQAGALRASLIGRVEKLTFAAPAGMSTPPTAEEAFTPPAMVRIVFAKFSTVAMPRSGANTQMGAVSLP